MDPVTFARHFARLVWLLVHEPASVDEQKATLRALVLAAKEGAVSMSVRDEELAANATAVASAFAGVREVIDRLGWLELAGLDVDVNAGAAELLGVARSLAGATPGGDSAAKAQQRAGLGGSHVHPVERPGSGALLDLELLDPVDEEVVVAPRRPRLGFADVAPTGSGGGGGLFDQFAPAARITGAPPGELLGELERTTDLNRVDLLLDELVVLAEQALHDAKPLLVSEILYGIVRRDSVATDVEERRLIATALRRVAKPTLLRVVATLLPRAPDRRDALMAVLTRAGEEGADAVVEQIATAAKQSDRRCYFDALLQLQAGVPALIHMLGDTRWYVARNAADLLGEMQARDAEQPLTWLLQHDDDRVRRSATGALMRLGTPRALQAIQATLREGVPQMRIQAALALVARSDVRSAAPLLHALERETDEEVQAAILLALGRMGTPDAVKRLILTSEPERALFRRKASTLRVAAVQALGEVRAPEAADALKALTSDKQSEVRDAATFALAKQARQADASA